MPMDQTQPQPKKPAKKPDSDIRSKVMAAKTALGLKDLNVAAAVAGHKMYQAHAAKNPTMSSSQLLNKVSPNARTNYLKLSSAVPTDILDAPMNQFRTTLQKLKQVGGSMAKLNNSVDIDITDVEQISEALQDEIQPGPMLVLRRKGIRIFPDGRRVALYTNDKLGLVFTIPYTPGEVGKPVTIPGVQSEETDLMESLEQVAAYASQEQPKALAKHMKFADGSKLKVSHGAAKAIHLVHGALNDENKKKFAEMLKTPKGFEKAAHFALSKVEYTIGGK
jgi:hypothetical protein